jgi:hypothetical protein
MPQNVDIVVQQYIAINIVNVCQQQTQSFMGWLCVPSHYVVIPTGVEVGLRLSWAVTISLLRSTFLLEGIINGL